MLKIEIEQEKFIRFNLAEIAFEVGSEDLSIKYTVGKKLLILVMLNQLQLVIGYWLFKFYF